jgi:2,3-bisphosphoglycerate-dependent phosphoglycerate mutase
LLVRHGESVGNVARIDAELAGHLVIDIAARDMDVDLSARGELQAESVGRWLTTLGRRKPQAVLASPYVRAARSASIALRAAGLDDVPLALDERLREREFGVLDRLTHAGIADRYPEQAEARLRIGKFYHRPPGGESWCDVVLRVRSVIDSVSREQGGRHVLVVAHQVVILAFRYVLEQMNEAQLLTIAREHDLANASITSYVAKGRAEEGMRLEEFNLLLPVEEAGLPVTRESDDPVAPR